MQHQDAKTTYLVDVSNTLSVVELSVLGGVDSLNLDEALVLILSNLRSINIRLTYFSILPSVAEDGTLNVKSGRSVRHCL